MCRLRRGARALHGVRQPAAAGEGGRSGGSERGKAGQTQLSEDDEGRRIPRV
jgi:hypothetical protein